MEKLHHLWRALRKPFCWVDFLYVLQLEEYYLKEYVVFVSRYWWRRDIQEKQRVEWTSRLKLTGAFSLGAFYGFWVVLFLVVQSWLLLLVFYISHFLIPLVIAFSVLALRPVVALQKKRVLAAAKERRLGILRGVHVIAVAGSYGKTTSKYFLKTFLRYTHKVVATPGNINTTIGVAQWMVTLKSVPDILIIEMDTYGPGELNEMCDYVLPDSFLLTSVGTNHLERFGSAAELRSALLEPLTFLDGEKGISIVPEEVNVGELKGLDFVRRVVESVPRDRYDIGTDMSETMEKNLAKVLPFAEYFHVPHHIIQDEIGKLSLPDRRRDEKVLHGFQVIDDSYNISLESAKTGLAYGKGKVDASGKKYGVIIAGIPEQGEQESQVHIEIVKKLNESADFVVVLDSIYASDLLDGLEVEYVSNAQLRSIEDAWVYIQENFDVDDMIWHMFPELTDLSYIS